MHLVATVVADEQPFELVQPGEGSLDDPADAAEAGAVLGFAARDLRRDPALTQRTLVGRVVVTSVGGQSFGTSARSTELPAHRRHRIDERDQLRHVVAIAAGHAPGERDPGRVYEKVMLGAVSGSINRARARRGAPLFACT